jgi:hypothetical protein
LKIRIFQEKASCLIQARGFFFYPKSYVEKLWESCWNGCGKLGKTVSLSVKLERTANFVDMKSAYSYFSTSRKFSVDSWRQYVRGLLGRLSTSPHPLI